jgi:Tol biopolymer transport system component
MEAQPNAPATLLAPGCMGSYSPDGSQIVFASHCLDPGEIWVMNADGSNLHALTSDGRNRNPAWSPDGHWIVFDYENSEYDHDLYIMDVNGGNRIPLTTGPANDASPSWQPFP